MSKVILLNELKAFTLDVTRDLIFPVAQQKEVTILTSTGVGYVHSFLSVSHKHSLSLFS